MKTRLLPLILVLCLPLWSLAQTKNERMTWYFADYGGLSFKTNPPSILTDSRMSTMEACAVASDRLGKLLFYSNGDTVWNSQHKAMPNGRGLNGHQSSTQGVIIVPHPKDSAIFYIFNTGMSSMGDFTGLYYSELDMRLDGGKGDINPAKKNIMLLDECTEKLAAVQHANGIDIWVATRKHDGKYVSFLVNALGVEADNPRISDVGAVSILDPMKAVGAMEFSPDGRVAAAAHSGLGMFEYLNFNNKNGSFYNCRQMNLSGHSLYGVLFSRNSRFLYISGRRTIDQAAELFQFDTYIAKDSVMMKNAAQIVSKYMPSAFCGIQWAPDGALYIACVNGRYLAKVPFPDKIYPVCGFQDSAIMLPAYSKIVGLPYLLNYSNYRFRFSDFSACDQKYAAFQFIDILNDTSIKNIEWDFGDNIKLVQKRSPTGWDQIQHFYYKPGEHVVKVKIFYDSKIELIQRSVFIKKPTLSTWGDTLKLCENSVYWLVPGGTEEYKYIWQDGTDSNVYKVSKPGLYWVRIDNGYCITQDSFIVIQDSARFKVNLGPDTNLCNNEPFIMDAGYDNATYSWQDGSTSKTYKTYFDGVFWVTVNRAGFYCPAADTIWVRYRQKPKVNLGPDRTVCEGDSAVYKLKPKDYTYINWQDGSADTIYKAKADGLYVLTVKDKYCFGSDSVNLLFHQKQDLGVNPSYVFCQGSSISLDLNGKADSVVWGKSGNSLQFFTDSSGLYRYSYKQAACWYKDSLEVTVLNVPSFNIKDTLLCKNDLIVLNPKIKGATYVWQDGSTDSMYLIDDWGVYWVSATNICGSSSDTFAVADCICRFHIPNAFSPDNDGLNDVFLPLGCEPRYYHLSIYNRWGELVFESSDPKLSWDGKYNGSPAPDGVYVWQLEYADTPKQKRHNKLMRGTVALLR